MGVQTHVNGSEQYSENMVTRTSRTYSSFVSSVAVTSMKMSLVSSEILVPFELICSKGVSDEARIGASQHAYDRRHAKNLTGARVDDGVHGRVLDDVQELAEVLVLLRRHHSSQQPGASLGANSR